MLVQKRKYSQGTYLSFCYIFYVSKMVSFRLKEEKRCLHAHWSEFFLGLRAIFRYKPGECLDAEWFWFYKTFFNCLLIRNSIHTSMVFLLTCNNLLWISIWNEKQIEFLFNMFLCKSGRITSYSDSYDMSHIENCIGQEWILKDGHPMDLDAFIWKSITKQVNKFWLSRKMQFFVKIGERRWYCWTTRVSRFCFLIFLSIKWIP